MPTNETTSGADNGQHERDESEKKESLPEKAENGLKRIAEFVGALVLLSTVVGAVYYFFFKEPRAASTVISVDPKSFTTPLDQSATVQIGLRQDSRELENGLLTVDGEFCAGPINLTAPATTVFSCTIYNASNDKPKTMCCPPGWVSMAATRCVGMDWWSWCRGGGRGGVGLWSVCRCYSAVTSVMAVRVEDSSTMLRPVAYAAMSA